MVLQINGFDDSYELESLARMIFHNVSLVDKISEDEYIIASMDALEDGVSLSVTIKYKGKEATDATTVGTTLKKAVYPLGLLLYKVSREHFGIHMRWGTLTGIRPIKLYHNLLNKGYDDQQVAKAMKEKFAPDDEMSHLCLRIAHTQQSINLKALPNGYSLYISIPFCPQRCSYCSFVSQSVERDRSLLPEYTQALCREIALTAATARELNLTLQTIYIGGGTPTVLDAVQLEEILNAVKTNFDTANLLEYTVEAGRPDTITREKLELLRNFGVNRISVNPQTMNDDILNAVGRHHTGEDIINTYKMAQTIGFSAINMDLIAGLPGDTLEGFKDSINNVISLNPENITVHALTLKRGTALTQGGADEHFKKEQMVSDMVDYARNVLMQNKYSPYYLYRQKGTIGNLDNTGYARENHECIYNIYMMEEVQTVLSCGGGSVTRINKADGGISRIFSHKLPYEYIKDCDRINRQQVMIKREMI